MLPIPTAVCRERDETPPQIPSRKASVNSQNIPNNSIPPQLVEISSNAMDSAQCASIKDLSKDPIKLGQYLLA